MKRPATSITFAGGRRIVTVHAETRRRDGQLEHTPETRRPGVCSDSHSAIAGPAR